MRQREHDDTRDGNGAASLMLELIQQPGEEIMIGDAIIVTVMSVVDGLVRLTIQVPREVAVLHEELIERRVPPNESDALFHS
ncbi:carbon storage regulator [Dyella japonica]|uniref:Carbon storage regulator CsrA n=1 Tax=Dyella japonica TaxID=231455 RepID=A0ABV2K138_9GAMM